MDDRDYMMLLVQSVRVLAGRQVTSVSEIYRVITGESSADEAPPELIDVIVQILRDHGYVKRWVRRIDKPGTGFLWVRDAWRIDGRANAVRGAACYVPFY